MDIWSWICNLPSSDEWPESDSPLVFQLATSSQDNPTESILLKAERTSGPNPEAMVTFSVCLQGFNPSNHQKTLWVSDPCSLSTDNPFLSLILQLLQETISRAPTSHDTTCPRSQLQKLKPEPVSWILDSHSPESFSSFFNLVFFCRLFWLCVCDAPTEVGFLYFHSLISPNLDTLICKHVLRTFLISVGVDAELGFMRTLGYMLVKWLILREVGVGLQSLVPLPFEKLGFSYATESHGFWVLKGYAPVVSMKRTCFNGQQDPYPILEAKESVLRYALAHQQLEAVIQLEYSVGFYNNFIQVSARVDNLRFHVAKLGFSKNDDGDYAEERHFPSRIRVWVGPEIGSTYVSGLSLGRSTDNIEREVEMQKIVKGSFGKSKFPQVNATSRASTKTRMRNWRWEQDAEGNAAVFEAVLCDNTSGIEVATWKPTSGGNPKSGFKKRYSGASRPFGKNGGLVFAGDDYGERVEWRLSKEMEGSVLKWRLGGKVWLSFWPNGVNSPYFETRCVDWCEEVDLPLIPGK
ncbi:hypothetical protein HHK36_008328 [Tetracentron sinense]|uniref:Uncharacterized protein n=1 Tax=Tetracentron sinense TaxID=13715 RepID=A0A835DJU1_TETSI|nr:hypothetical protein HHK36_008328 [Tetracentron sinense]